MKKEMFEAKAGYVENKNSLNRDILNGKFSDAQIGSIESLCQIRHELHSNAAISLYCSESADFNEYLNLYELGITRMMGNAGFNDFPSINIDPCDFASDSDWYNDCVDKEDYEDIDAFYASAIEENSKIVNEVNSQIEKWLRDFDEKNGTSYAPTGFARLMK